ncbi:hypothetical protein Tco_1162169 [Tanacetum coccineum]
MGDHNRFRHQSKEDQTHSISKSVFVTNFPDHICARDLWKVRFERDHKPKQPDTFNKKDTRTGVPKVGVPCTMPSGIPRGSFASILKEGSPSLSNPDLHTPAIVLEDSCLKERDFSMSLMGLWVLIKLDSQDSFEKLRNHIGVGSWFSSIKPASNSFVSDERIVWVSLEGLPINVWTMNTFSKVAAKWGDLVVWEDSEENSLSFHWIRTKELDAWVPKLLSESDLYSSNDDTTDLDEGCQKSVKEHTGTLCSKHKINFVALQETKMESMDLFTIKALWGNFSFDHAIVSSSDYFLAIMGTWVPSSTKLLVILVYAPQELSEKRELWGLIDIPLGGYSHTWSHKSASKMSKLDRFLISEGLMAMNPILSGLCLDRHLSDLTIPILISAMKTSVKDSKLKKNKAKSYVQDKFLRWLKHSDSSRCVFIMELSQKAKVRWPIEGDENSKYFHGIINNKRSQLSIRGILIDGDWIFDPKEVKTEFLNHFAKQFSKPSSPPVSIDGMFPNRLNLEQIEELESSISQDEIKKAV